MLRRGVRPPQNLLVLPVVQQQVISTHDMELAVGGRPGCWRWPIATLRARRQRLLRTTLDDHDRRVVSTSCLLLHLLDPLPVPPRKDHQQQDRSRNSGRYTTHHPDDDRHRLGAHSFADDNGQSDDEHDCQHDCDLPHDVPHSPQTKVQASFSFFHP